jgi:predicted transglutaminase-like cysteine proteinase
MTSIFKKTSVWMLALIFVCHSVLAIESGAALELKKIAEETSAINIQKNQVLQAYQVEAKTCWQLFAVNDCLAKARRDKYQRLAPIEQLEIALNAKRRELKEADRLQRLNEKHNSEVNPNNDNKATP